MSRYRIVLFALLFTVATFGLRAEDLSDLPLIELPGSAASSSKTVAFILSGDGGWSQIDRNIAAAINAHHIPVVGWIPCYISGPPALRREPRLIWGKPFGTISPPGK